MQTVRQTITVDSVIAAKRATAKIIEGARKRLRPEKEVLSSSDEEMYKFAMAGVSDEAILKQEAYKRKSTVDKRFERRVEASARLAERRQRLETTNLNLQKAAWHRKQQLRRKRQAVDPLPDVPFWPETGPLHTVEPGTWRCPRFPGSDNMGQMQKLVFKLAISVDSRCLVHHNAIGLKMQVKETQGGLHCVVSWKPFIAIHVAGGRATLCEDEQCG